jgi:hypothetical protein
MKNPTVEQVNFVIKKLELVRKQASQEDALDMNEARVYSGGGDKYECGTVHCVAGWYAVANSDRQVIKDKIKKGRVGFDDGANLMAQDLGFGWSYPLKNWAEENPEIWGNDDGFEMFESELAYDNAGFDGVIMQWCIVRDNLIKLEASITTTKRRIK